MSLWKQVLLVLVLAAAGVVGWGAYDPSARQTLVGLGIPEQALPAWAFLAKAPADAAGKPAGTGQGQGSGQQGQGSGQAQAGGQRQGGQGGGGQGGGGQGGGGGRGPGGPVTVVAAPAAVQRTNDRVTAIGTTQADKSVTVFPRSTGMIEEIAFQPGERVQAGAVLARLDDDAETIALERAKLALADAEAKADRYKTLAGSRAIAQVDRDTAVSERSAAQLAVRDATLALDRRKIVAPFTGVVGLTNVDVGAMVSATTEIVTIDDRATLKLEFRIPEGFASKVALGQEVDAETPALPGETFKGEVAALGSRVEEDSRTLVVQARLDNTADRLRPGMSFKVTLRFAGEDKIAVPALSVQWDRDGSYVWRIAGDSVDRVAVTIVERNADTILVSGELAAGDSVVVEGVQRLRKGAKIALADARTEPAAGTGGAVPASEKRG